MAVVLDIGHGPGSPTSVHGARSAWAVERECVEHYVKAAAEELAIGGAPVRVLSEGPYHERNQDDLVATADLYVACHVNAGRGTYALALHDHGREQARAACAFILNELHQLPGITHARRGEWGHPRPQADAYQPLSPPMTVGSRTFHVQAWPERGRVCIAEVPEEVPALVVEPFFIDTPSHRPLTQRRSLREVGRRLAQGILAWRRR